MSETTTVELPVPPNFARSSPFTIDESMNLKKPNSNTNEPTKPNLASENLAERERKQELPPKDPPTQPLTNTTDDTLFVLQVLRTVLNLDQSRAANEEDANKHVGMKLEEVDEIMQVVEEVVAQVAKDGKQEQSDQLEPTAVPTTEPTPTPTPTQAPKTAPTTAPTTATTQPTNPLPQPKQTKPNNTIVQTELPTTTISPPKTSPSTDTIEPPFVPPPPKKDTTYDAKFTELKNILNKAETELEDLNKYGYDNTPTKEQIKYETDLKNHIHVVTTAVEHARQRASAMFQQKKSLDKQRMNKKCASATTTASVAPAHSRNVPRKKKKKKKSPKTKQALPKNRTPKDIEQQKKEQEYALLLIEERQNQLNNVLNSMEKQRQKRKKKTTHVPTKKKSFKKTKRPQAGGRSNNNRTIFRQRIVPDSTVTEKRVQRFNQSPRIAAIFPNKTKQSYTQHTNTVSFATGVTRQKRTTTSVENDQQITNKRRIETIPTSSMEKHTTWITCSSIVFFDHSGPTKTFAGIAKHELQAMEQQHPFSRILVTRCLTLLRPTTVIAFTLGQCTHVIVAHCVAFDFGQTCPTNKNNHGLQRQRHRHSGRGWANFQDGFVDIDKIPPHTIGFFGGRIDNVDRNIERTYFFGSRRRCFQCDFKILSNRKSICHQRHRCGTS